MPEKGFFETLVDEVDAPSEEEADSNGKGKPVEKTVHEEQYKNLQEHTRQQSEKIKEQERRILELEERWNRITGNTPEEQNKRKELDIRKKYEDDPVKFQNEIFEEKLKPIKEQLELTNMKSELDRAMDEIEEEYDVDFEGKQDNISKYIEQFSLEARRLHPKEILLSACKLAGVLKKKETLPYIENGTVRSTGKAPQKKDYGQSLKEAMVKSVKQKFFDMK